MSNHHFLLRLITPDGGQTHTSVGFGNPLLSLDILPRITRTTRWFIIFGLMCIVAATAQGCTWDDPCCRVKPTEPCDDHCAISAEGLDISHLATTGAWDGSSSRFLFSDLFAASLPPEKELGVSVHPAQAIEAIRYWHIAMRATGTPRAP